ncbi:MAG: hypothetical protein FWE61_08125 [Micrococcales bacterium]|nr:hypothetical protein [Micrococcales bacterium]
MGLFGGSKPGWDAAISFLTNTYKCEKVDNNSYKLLFGLPGGRDQIVIVARDGNDSAGEWLSFSSPIGDLADVGPRLPDLLRECSDTLCGGVVAFGETVVLRHSIPVTSFTPDSFTWALEAITATADQFEEKFTGGNKY